MAVPAAAVHRRLRRPTASTNIQSQLTIQRDEHGSVEGEEISLLNTLTIASGGFRSQTERRRSLFRHLSTTSTPKLIMHIDGHQNKPIRRGTTRREKSIRWEELPLTGTTNITDTRQPATANTGITGDTDGTVNMLRSTDATTGHVTKNDEPKPFTKRLSKSLKILLPHIGLTVLLLSYIAGGAGVLMWLESAPEMARRREKLENVTRLYSVIFEASYNACQYPVSSTDPEYIRDRIKPYLQQLSMVHEYDDRFTSEDQLWNDDKEKLRSRWTFQAAVLYSLTVVTTTGYDHVSPLTDAGRLFAVFFGLIGIPLMFITAADIGKFLSEVVTKSYAKFVQLTRCLSRKIGNLRRKPSTASANGSAHGVTTGGSTGGGSECRGQDERRKSIMDDPLYGFEAGNLDEANDHVELPVFAYFGLILGYCAMGGLLFTSFETGPIWSFVHGFFFSFNTITTIGLGNVLVRNALYLLLIVVYCIVGLAVITMCVDLASAQLKVLFTKLHYFGRKFRGARSTFMTMSDDIREAIRIIAALKKSRPSKGAFTLEDIKQFLEIESQYMARPFIPKNIHFIRWVDEDETSASIRSNSFSVHQQHHHQQSAPSSPKQRDGPLAYRSSSRRHLLHSPPNYNAVCRNNVDEHVHI